ncbi:3-hydroxy-3-methylglutaryl-CoA reductase [Streptomyces axinellae]|uniref:Hydroxymethylglutaryl-CoA reductase (NADPH) n=1 Tax=Streptomyces axinellae TaxID=552788 RepID=A0ABP6C8A4_9ACTN
MSEHFSRNDMQQRVGVVKKLAGPGYEDLQTALTEEQVAGNIENFVGAVPVPLGLCGPVEILGEHANGSFIVPMATLEGTLVASYSRGVKAMNMSGGCETLVYGDAFLRGVQFNTASLGDAVRLFTWCKQKEAEIRKLTARDSNHLRPLEITYEHMGSSVLLSISCDTGDAMGSNMSSKAISEVANYITAHSGLVQDCVLPYPEDKKFLPARRKGKKVVARTVLRRDVVAAVTRTSLERLHHFVADYKNLLALHGSYSLNIHAANGLAGMFQAFGQDMAYLAECSQAIVDTRFIDKDKLEVSVTLPTLIVGTVGGGTGLPAYQATLSMVGCAGSGKAKKLAEIMTSVVLAGEIGCAAAQCAHEFVTAHETLGKNRPLESVGSGAAHSVLH